MRALLVLLVFLWPLAAGAVQPDEMLSDPVLEQRAQALDHQLRCVLCRSESIASSNADWAADARVIVRELLTDGNTDQQVLDFFVARYGDFVLMTPPVSGVNVALWLAAPVLFLLVLLFMAMRFKNRDSAAPVPLTPDERDAIERLTRD